VIVKIIFDFFFLIYTLIIVFSFYLVDVLRSSIMSQLIILFCFVSFSNYHYSDYINQFETAIMKRNNFTYHWNKCLIHMNLFSLFLIWIHYKTMKIYRVIVDHDEWHLELKSFWVSNFIRCKWNFLIFTFLDDATSRDSSIDSELMFKSRFKSWFEWLFERFSWFDSSTSSSNSSSSFSSFIDKSFTSIR
jgi:hypothetical protein